MKQPMVDIYGIDYFESMWHQWVDVFSTMEKDEKGIINLYREVSSCYTVTYWCYTLVCADINDILTYWQIEGR